MHFLVIGFERREDAQRGSRRCIDGKRNWSAFETMNAPVHPEKTRLIAFERPEPGTAQWEGAGATVRFSVGFFDAVTGDGRGTDTGQIVECKTRSRRCLKAIQSNASREHGVRRHFGI